MAASNVRAAVAATLAQSHGRVSLARGLGALALLDEGPRHRAQVVGTHPDILAVPCPTEVVDVADCRELWPESATVEL